MLPSALPNACQACVLHQGKILLFACTAGTLGFAALPTHQRLPCFLAAALRLMYMPIPTVSASQQMEPNTTLITVHLSFLKAPLGCGAHRNFIKTYCTGQHANAD